MHWKFFVPLLILLCVVASVPLLSHIESKPALFAYGDSITRATTGDPSRWQLNPDGRDCYINYAGSDLGLTTGHNGLSGYSSVNGIDHIGEVPESGIVVYMFTNDAYWGESETAMQQSYENIYTNLTKRGAIAVPAMPILQVRNDSKKIPISIEYQRSRITNLEKYLGLKHIRYLKMYDAIDDSEDGRPGEPAMQYLPDGTHPNLGGHMRMGNYTARWLEENIPLQISDLHYP